MPTGANGTYTVTFKGIGFFNSARQTVSADFAKGKHAELGPGKALWPLVIERAYAQEKGGIAVVDKGGSSGDAVDDILNNGPSRSTHARKPQTTSSARSPKARPGSGR